MGYIHIYIYIFYLIVFSFFIPKINNLKIRLFFLLFPMFIILGFQFAIGADFFSYLEIFKSLKGIESLEYGFKKYIYIIRLFTLKGRIFFLLTAGLQVFLLYKIIYKLVILKIIKKKDIQLYIYIYIVISNNFDLMFNALRSSIASLFFVLASIYYMQKKTNIFIILIFFGFLFHKSIIIAVFLLIFMKMIKKIEKKYYFFILVIFLLISNFDYLQLGARYIYEHTFEFPYKNYLISRHMFSYVKENKLSLSKIYNIIMIFFSALCINKKEQNLSFKMGMLYISLFLLFYKIPILTRLLEYGGIFISCYYLNFFKKFKNKKMVCIKYLLLGGYLIIYISGSYNSHLIYNARWKKAYGENYMNYYIEFINK